MKSRPGPSPWVYAFWLMFGATMWLFNCGKPLWTPAPKPGERVFCDSPWPSTTRR